MIGDPAKKEARAQRREERDQARAEKWAAESEALRARLADEFERQDAEQFNDTPKGQARLARERGDTIFQAALTVSRQRAVIAPMVGSTTSVAKTDISSELNDIISEGWELINSSVVFEMHGQESRDKFLSSGQQVAVSGESVGYYLFRRLPS